MAHCLRCQHELGVGRYCMNCGYPVDAAMPSEAEQATWRTDTTERPAVRRPDRSATAPPPAFEPPPAARYPLFADEAAPAQTQAPATSDSAEIVLGAMARSAASSSQNAGVRTTSQRSRRGVPWVLVLLGLVVIALVVAWRLIDGSPDGSAATPNTTDVPGSSAPSAPTTTGGAGPDTSGDGETARARNVARRAVVEVPATAPDSRDVAGNAVRYDAENMLDGDRQTAWRMPGDGTGEELVVHLDEPVRLTTVGLLNGYAKTDPGYDGYLANRRILEVEWEFDDGSVVTQTLDEARKPQRLSIAPVLTSTVRLRLVSVSAPGAGRSARDFTAISELVLRGTPA